MKNKPILFAVIKFFIDIVGMALMLFVSAGSFRYASGWGLLIVLAIVGVLYGIFMYVKHPKLLTKRLVDRENSFIQVVITGIALGVFCTAIILAGITFRLGWYILPAWRYAISGLLAILGGFIYLRVISVNSFLSTTIKTENNQTVVQSGPYGIIRHPMYASVILLMMAVFFWLGSLVSIAVTLLFIPSLVMRIVYEEKKLLIELDGYEEYTRKVKYRLIPYVW